MVDGPVKMVIIPPRNYCVIDNPCEKDASGNVILDKFGELLKKLLREWPCRRLGGTQNRSQTPGTQMGLTICLKI